MSFSPAASQWWCFAALAAVTSLLASCAGASQLSGMQDTQANLQRFRAATQVASECRATAARKERYRILDQRIPLTDIGAASLPQMVDTRLATSDEIAALGDWTLDLNACREQLLLVTASTFPSFGPIIEASRDEDDAVFVKLANHELTWGQALLRLRINRTKLRAEVIARADQVAADLEKLQQQQLNRRTAILSSVLGILP